MTPSPPRPNLRWLIDSQHACTYVPSNWGIGLVYVVAWINQLDGRACTAELLQATETEEPSTPSELQSHKPSNPRKSHDAPPGSPPLQAPMSRNVLACSLWRTRGELGRRVVNPTQQHPKWHRWKTLQDVRTVQTRQGRPCSRRELSFHGVDHALDAIYRFTGRPSSRCLGSVSRFASVWVFPSFSFAPKDRLHLHRSTIPNSTATGLATPKNCTLLCGILFGSVTLLARSRRCTLSCHYP